LIPPLIWSPQEIDWRPLGDFAEGDVVSTLDGLMTLQSLERRSTPNDVFNIEVDENHRYRILSTGVLVHNADYSQLVRSIKGVLENYPKVLDPRTGRFLEFPSAIFTRVGRAANTPAILSPAERVAFLDEWVRRGIPLPPAPVQIHHIHPVEWGGDKGFANLIPLNVTVHQEFNSFWTVIRLNSNPFGKLI